MPIIIWIVIIIIVMVNVSKKITGNGAGNKAPVNENRPQSAGTATPSGSADTVSRPQNIRPNVSRPTYERKINDGCNNDFLLNERSEFDESEHPKLDQGQGIIAGRSEEWNTTTRGSMVVKCHYCGAYNQIPARRNGTYKCYFCWRKL